MSLPLSVNTENQKRPLLGKPAAAFVYLLFLASCTAFGVMGRWTSDLVNSLTDSNTGLADIWKGISNPRALFPDKDRLVVLLVGQDYNRDRKGIAYTKNSRSDTIMMLSVDLARKSVRACSIPRDTYVRAPDGIGGKINGTFARGGVQLLIDTLEQEFDVKIDNYIVIKPSAVSELVDSVGGVTVEALDNMNYDDNWGGLHVHLPAGVQRLDGEKAEGFVRFREVNRYRMDERGRMIPLRNVESSKEEGDIRRAARQQQLVAALMHEANRPANMMRADKIINTGFSQIDTNLTRTQCLGLATIFRGFNSSSMKSGTVPGDSATEDGAYYYKLDRERAQATVDWLVKGDDSAMRRLVRVSVKNGSGTSGLARTTATQIDGIGYTAFSSGNAPNAAETTVVFRRADYSEAAEEISRLIGAPSPTKATDPGNDWDPEIQVVIGKDLAAKAAQNATPAR